MRGLPRSQVLQRRGAAGVTGQRAAPRAGLGRRVTPGSVFQTAMATARAGRTRARRLAQQVRVLLCVCVFLCVTMWMEGGSSSKTVSGKHSQCSSRLVPGPANQWAGWGAWGACTTACGTGEQQRRRACEGGCYGDCGGTELGTGTKSCTAGTRCISPCVCVCGSLYEDRCGHVAGWFNARHMCRRAANVDSLECVEQLLVRVWHGRADAGSHVRGLPGRVQRRQQREQAMLSRCVRLCPSWVRSTRSILPFHRPLPCLPDWLS